MICKVFETMFSKGKYIEIKTRNFKDSKNSVKDTTNKSEFTLKRNIVTDNFSSFSVNKSNDVN